MIFDSLYHDKQSNFTNPLLTPSDDDDVFSFDDLLAVNNDINNNFEDPSFDQEVFSVNFSVQDLVSEIKDEDYESMAAIRRDFMWCKSERDRERNHTETSSTPCSLVRRLSEKSMVTPLSFDKSITDQEFHGESEDKVDKDITSVENQWMGASGIPTTAENDTDSEIDVVNVFPDVLVTDDSNSCGESSSGRETLCLPCLEQDHTIVNQKRTSQKKAKRKKQKLEQVQSRQRNKTFDLLKIVIPSPVEVISSNVKENILPTPPYDVNVGNMWQEGLLIKATKTTKEDRKKESQELKKVEQQTSKSKFSPLQTTNGNKVLISCETTETTTGEAPKEKENIQTITNPAAAIHNASEEATLPPKTSIAKPTATTHNGSDEATPPTKTRKNICTTIHVSGEATPPKTRKNIRRSTAMLSFYQFDSFSSDESAEEVIKKTATKTVKTPVKAPVKTPPTTKKSTPGCHNNMERKRRIILKRRFDELKLEIPDLEARSSKQLILKGAIQLIDSLHKEEAILLDARGKLTTRHQELSDQIKEMFCEHTQFLFQS